MTSLRIKKRLNPESCDGSLVWWLQVPTSRQNDLQAILEGYDDLGYYQTFHTCTGKNEHGEPVSLARLTSTVDAKVETKRLLEALSHAMNLEILDGAPSFRPSEQPRV